MSTRSRRVVLLIIAIAAIAAGAAFFMRPKAPAAPVKAVATPPVLEFLPQEVFTTAPLDLQKTLSLSGALRAFDTATVKARVAADVREVLVREGEAVKSGQIIVKMDATEYLARVEQARGNLNAARAQLDIATKNRDNNRALVDKGFISRNAFENYASQYAAAEATVEAAKAALDVVQKSLNDTVIRAPISGLIAMRYVQPGEKVSADHKLLDIVDLRKMELEAAVPTSDIASVALHQRVMLRVEGLGSSLKVKWCASILRHKLDRARCWSMYGSIIHRDHCVRACSPRRSWYWPLDPVCWRCRRMPFARTAMAPMSMSLTGSDSHASRWSRE